MGKVILFGAIIAVVVATFAYVALSTSDALMDALR